jgi:PAS domain S-box-containing protein
MSERMRDHDWSRSSLGPAALWPQALKTAVKIMLTSRQPMFIWWGDELINLYNDPYKSILGRKHPSAFAQPAPEIWREIWPQIGPRAEKALSGTEGTYDSGLRLIMERNGYPEETYYTFSYSPISDDDGKPAGIFCANSEDTQRILSERQLALLGSLASSTSDARSLTAACQGTMTCLATDPHDLPFAMIYLVEAGGEMATLAGTTGIEPGHTAVPGLIPVGESELWPVSDALGEHSVKLVTNLADRFGPLPTGPWDRPPHQAVILPISASGQSAVLIAGLNPFRIWSDEYRRFIELISAQITASLGNARAYEEERGRAEVLAELDRAKTVFFSNVSHEFRTPLTLMLGPLDELISGTDSATLPPDILDRLSMVRRNGQRLLRLVNTLLEFSRIEAGRIEAAYQPVDLAAITAELASMFRSAVESAGMRLIVDCQPLPEPVYVDRDMWEKILLNLLSNAFKYTMQGQIEVSIHATGGSALLVVRDTGIGIPEADIPRLFQRFHRVEGARGRTHEGTGIGLALVHELVLLHGGGITVHSEVGAGSTFTVAIPLGKSHLPPERIARPQPSTAPVVSQFLDEINHWSPSPNAPAGYHEIAPVHTVLPAGSPGSEPRSTGHILVADDNRDMREYISRILSTAFRVSLVVDGHEALAHALEHRPDLVLTDVMMPQLDGFGLLSALRNDPRTATTPVIMLSARAGDEARVEGLAAGADDYLTKPFSARELVARVRSNLELAAVRREASRRQGELEGQLRALHERSEQAIKESEARISLAVSSAKFGLWDWDIKNDIVIWNEHHETIMGYEPGTPIRDYRQFADRVHPEDLPTLERGFQEAMDKRGEYHFIHRVVWPEGSIRWVEARGHFFYNEQGEAFRSLGIMADITEKRRTHEALKRSEERLRAIAEATPECAMLIDHGGTILSINPAGLRMFEARTPSQVEGHPIFPWLAPESVEPFREFNSRVVRGHSGILEFDLIGLAANRRSMEMHSVPLEDPDGSVIHLAVARDVTHRKLLENELKRRNAALIEDDRRKDEFLATLAHELRNPLAPLRSGLEVMKLAAHDPATVEQARAMMDRQLHQMIRLVDDLLDLSRISRGKVELRHQRVNLADVIASAVETSRPLIEQCGHELSIHLPPEPIIVEADTTRLAQVIANLLNNSAKYTERGGRLNLSVSADGAEVAISVTDNGVGIPPAMLPTIFQMFTQVERSLDRSQGGLGIGLTIVKQLVELHGGRVEARSSGLGQGSTFIVTLPIARPEPAPLSRSGLDDDAQSAAIANHGRRILVVDDNRDAAHSLSTLLELMGNESRAAYDGLEALSLAETYRPEIVLLDIGMPNLNGYDTARKFREISWGKPVILVALTGWGQTEDKKRSTDAGFDHHLVKPVEMTALQSLLSTLHRNPKS